MDELNGFELNEPFQLFVPAHCTMLHCSAGLTTPTGSLPWRLLALHWMLDRPTSWLTTWQTN